MSFILETDHSNLLWIEQSIVPMIIRWRVYLQSYALMKRYIKGSTNIVSDLGSRQVSDSNAMQNLNNMSPASTILQLVHGGRRGHPGVRETYNRVNIEFPGHGLSHRVVQQFVEECPTCQKARLGLTDCFAAKVLSLPASHQRVAIGVDTVTVTPVDKAGNCCIIVVVFLNSKLAWLWPAKDHSAETMALALFNFFCRHGLCDEVRSDPGSDLTSEVIAQVHAWFGIKHVFSLVDRHESNGVEGTNKQILRHLRALVADERVNRIWSDPSVLPLVEYMINSSVSSETGITPFEAHYGTRAGTYFMMPANLTTDSERQKAFVTLLDDNLRVLQELSTAHHNEVVAKRQPKQDAPAFNLYQPGDLVLYKISVTDRPLPSKLTLQFSGPYKVITHVQNDVTAQHLVSGVTKVLHTDRLKIFIGSEEDAFKMAMLDEDQYLVQSITNFKGDPATRTTMSFKVTYADGDTRWVPYSRDISQTVQFEDYCNSFPPLRQLLVNAADAVKSHKALNKTPIVDVSPGDVFYVTLRAFSYTWFDDLSDILDEACQYVVKCECLDWKTQAHREIWISYPVFNSRHTVGNAFISQYFFTRQLSDSMKLVDAAMLRDKPRLREAV